MRIDHLLPSARVMPTEALAPREVETITHIIDRLAVIDLILLEVIDLLAAGRILEVAAVAADRTLAAEVLGLQEVVQELEVQVAVLADVDNY